MSGSCERCGGPHQFDTSLPSVTWNKYVRNTGEPEFLCLSCIVLIFSRSKRSFTATLWGEHLDGLAVEVRFDGAVAKDSAAIQDENNVLRAKVSLLQHTVDQLMGACGEA